MTARRLVLLLLPIWFAGCGERAPEPAASDPAAASQAGPAGVPATGPGVSQAASQVGDPCALLTEDEIRQSTGYAVLSSKQYDIGCRWNLDPGSGQPGIEHVAVQVLPSGGRQRFDFFVTGGHERLAGLGDGALRQNSNTGGTIWVLRGDRLYTFTFAFGIKTSDPIPLVVPLAEKVLAR